MKTKQVFSIASVALAVAMAAPTVSAGEASAYMTIRPMISSVDVDGDDKVTEVKDYFSRWGLKGSTELDNGMTVGAHGEWKIYDNTAEDYTLDAGPRLGYVYLSGDFGKVTVGRAGDAFYGVAAPVDFHWTQDAPYAYSLLANDWREPGMIRYDLSTDMFSVAAQYRKHAKAENAALNVSTEVAGLKLSASYKDYKKKFDADAGTNGELVDADRSAWAVSAGYSIDALSLGVVYGAAEKGKQEATAWEAGASYALGKTSLGFSFGEGDNDGAEKADGSASVGALAADIEKFYALSVGHKFASNLTGFVSYEVEDKYEAADQTRINIGFKFDLGVSSKMM